VAYTRYLPQHGCSVFVITAKNPATPLYDPALLQLVPPETTVIRAFNHEVSYQFRDRIWKRLAPPHRTKGAANQEAVAPGPGSGSPATGSKPSGGLKSALRALIERVTFPDVQSTWVPFALRKARHVIDKHQIDTVILNIPPYSGFRFAVELRKSYPKL